MEVLEALPDDIRKELDDEYQRRSHSPMVVEAVPAPMTSPSKVVAKGPTQQFALKLGSSLSQRRACLLRNATPVVLLAGASKFRC
ncbi:hypothetical protein L210DRAFT_3545743 [Boletus edulis BED1]|uniref:Uncharacterized protein n=1 Tax=Boletus edulis BED1 TaxID=1328754 RepID=A0AAD4B9W5_BOLED|nr:hypothetical protein L210DRAFT_3591727 [Boletus edulis BED1]KAF8437468.1 hypothetical protein L210DRAFT_3545743 [Boletus edulis BED1]